MITKILALISISIGAWSFPAPGDQAIYKGLALHQGKMRPVTLTREITRYYEPNDMYLLKQSVQFEGQGSIVNVSSTLGVRPTAGTGAYSAMKAAQINWAQSLALEGAQHGIRVNCVAAGIVDTPIHPPGMIHQMHSAQPLGRVGRPEEIAQSIYFLATEQSAWTTGSVLHVDGGINLL